MQPVFTGVGFALAILFAVLYAMDQSQIHKTQRQLNVVQYCLDQHQDKTCPAFVYNIASIAEGK